ncbi:MAG: hypothetical protein QNJ62_09450 [Methyloceanibacter sp.]|nr:hypothetical protein [Methyloceanibacter sp.]
MLGLNWGIAWGVGAGLGGLQYGIIAPVVLAAVSGFLGGCIAEGVIISTTGHIARWTVVRGGLSFLLWAFLLIALHGSYGANAYAFITWADVTVFVLAGALLGLVFSIWAILRERVQKRIKFVTMSVLGWAVGAWLGVSLLSL